MLETPPHTCRRESRRQCQSESKAEVLRGTSLMSSDTNDDTEVVIYDKRLCPFCKSGNNTQKQAFASYEHANEELEYWASKSKKMRIYDCPKGWGFHLATIKERKHAFKETLPEDNETNVSPKSETRKKLTLKNKPVRPAG